MITNGFRKDAAVLRTIEDRQAIAHLPLVEIHYCNGDYQKAFDDVTGMLFHEWMNDEFSRRWTKQMVDKLIDEVSGQADANPLYTKHTH